MKLWIAWLQCQTSITELLGRTPTKVFPGIVPSVVEGKEIQAPWVTLERNNWYEESTLSSGSTGLYNCTTSVVVVGKTAAEAWKIWDAMNSLMHNRYSVTWAERLFVERSFLDDAKQVPLFEPDGSLSALQQIVGSSFFQCEVIPV